MNYFEIVFYTFIEAGVLYYSEYHKNFKEDETEIELEH